MTLLISCETRTEPYTGSGSTVLAVISARRGMSSAPQLRAVLRARLLAVAHAGGVEGGADHLVADAPLLRRAAQRLCLRLGDGRRATFPDELVDGGQRKTLLRALASRDDTPNGTWSRPTPRP